MRFDSDSFGPYLRCERERRGITLDDIAERTKIARSLLAKLERGDLDGWPAGIFRRSFFREYASAIGIDADTMLAEFLRLFPDPGAEPFASAAPAPRPPADLRLTLAASDAKPLVWMAKLQTAIVDTAAILATTAILAAVFGHAAVFAATIAILYHATSTVWSGRSLGALVAERVAAGGRGAAAERQARPAHVEPRRSEAGRRARGHRRVVDTGAVRGTRAVS